MRTFFLVSSIVIISLTVYILSTATECNWDTSDSSKRRREFCNKLEGYGSVCSCQDPDPIDFVAKPVSHSSFHL